MTEVKKQATNLFTSRFGLIVALLGMAIGTGNIWRFPRVLAENGGGAFLIPWFLALFCWSIPLLCIEFSLGKNLRKGVVGSFQELTRGKWTWLGAFIVACTLGIMFYYSVVTGWCLHYLLLSLKNNAFANANTALYWQAFSQESYLPLFYHALCLAIAGGVIYRGAHYGIENLSKCLVPSIFLILLGLGIYSYSLPGFENTAKFVFDVDWGSLTQARTWLEGLTQSAWSTGAGWGLALSYACYAAKDNDVLKTPTITGLGNNTIELFAAFAILPALFSFFQIGEVQNIMQEGNTGLTFISLPALFNQIEHGRIISLFFFLGLFFAALTSLIAMYELGVRFLGDLQISRLKSIGIVGGIAFLAGSGSAINMSLLDNQDWVWGVGLLVNGFFFTLLVRHIGIEKFLLQHAKIKPGFRYRYLEFFIPWILPIEFLALLSWWFYQAMKWNPTSWWHPFETFSVGTCIAQWGLVLILLRLLNSRFNDRSLS